MLSQNGKKILAIVLVLSLLCLLVNGEKKFAKSEEQLEAKRQRVPVKRVQEVIVVEPIAEPEAAGVQSGDPIKGMGFDSEMLRRRKRVIEAGSGSAKYRTRASDDETDAETTDGDGLTSADESSDNELLLSDTDVRRRLRKRNDRKNRKTDEEDLTDGDSPSNSDASDDDSIKMRRASNDHDSDTDANSNTSNATSANESDSGTSNADLTTTDDEFAAGIIDARRQKTTPPTISRETPERGFGRK